MAKYYTLHNPRNPRFPVGVFYGAVAAAVVGLMLVTAAVTHGAEAAGRIPLPGQVWEFQAADPQDGLPFVYPGKFSSKDDCESFLVSEDGRAAYSALLAEVKIDYGPGYVVGPAECVDVTPGRNI